MTTDQAEGGYKETALQQQREGTGEHSEAVARGKEADTLEWTRSPGTESFSFTQRRAEVQREREQRVEDNEPQSTYLLSHSADKQLLPL